MTNFDIKFSLLFLFILIFLVDPNLQDLQAGTLSKPPSVPTGLAITQVTSSSVSLKWNAAKDFKGGLGIKNYDIFRNSGLVATTANLSYTDQNLTPSTQYQYAVRARNLQEKVSALSSPVSVTTLTPPCSTAPSTPTGLTVSWVTSGSINLSWNVVAPPTGCTVSYNVYRNTSFIVGGLSSPSFTDTGLSPSTSYSYSITASDAVGSSTQSPTVLGTTSAATSSAFPNYVFAPYIDMLLWPTPSLSSIATDSGSKFFSLGFIVARAPTDCTASWGTYYTMSQNFLASDISSLRSQGGDVIISFGGAANSELALACGTVSALQTQYKSVIDMYKVSRVDFDIEGSALSNATANDKRAKAIAGLQASTAAIGKILKVQFTLPVLPTGLTSNGLAFLQNAIQNGVDISTVNIMAMDYGSSYDPNMMGQHAVNAMIATISQLKTLYGSSKTDTQVRTMVGVTPMIGLNDVSPEVFTLSDASLLLDGAKTNNVGFIGFWSSMRDVQCSNGAATLSSTCSGILQAPWDFSQRMKAFNRN